MNKIFCVALVAVFCIIGSADAAFNISVARMVGLLKHNKLRAAHAGTPALVANASLDAFAQNWCDKLAKDNSNLVHNNFTALGYYLGENLFWQSGGVLSDTTILDNASQSWYDEISAYDYNNPIFAGTTGHFTQVVWKGSKSVGFGVSVSPTNAVYVCANYYPAGNYKGQFATNVLKKTA